MIRDRLETAVLWLCGLAALCYQCRNVYELLNDCERAFEAGLSKALGI